MSEMIERVRAAIQARAMVHGPDYEGMARAAIEAMREPTDEQYEALCATDKMWREMNSRFVWQTYIDGALGAPAPTP